MAAAYWIKTYSDYITSYIEDMGEWGSYPGEHHFVAMYLLPRLITLKTLVGLPSFVNPDGMKKQPGDIVYWWERRQGSTVTGRKCRLAIEVKHVNQRTGKFTFTRREYNQWLSNAADRNRGGKVPHLFIAVSKQGVVLLPWEDFRLRYLKMVYPKNPPREIKATKWSKKKKKHVKVRNAKPFNPRDFPWEKSTAAGYFTHDSTNPRENEALFLSALKETCERIWNQER